MIPHVRDDQDKPKSSAIASAHGHARKIISGWKNVSLALYILRELNYACLSTMTANAIIAIIAIIAKNTHALG